MNQRTAFTLWELLLTVSIIGILSSIAYPLYTGVRQTGEERIMRARTLALEAAMVTLEDRTPGVSELWNAWNAPERYQQLVQRGHLKSRGLNWDEYQNGYVMVWPAQLGERIALYNPLGELISHE